MKSRNDGKSLKYYVIIEKKPDEKSPTLTKQQPRQVRSAGICQRNVKEKIQSGNTHKHIDVNEETHQHMRVPTFTMNLPTAQCTHS